MNRAKPEALKLNTNKPKRGQTIAWYPATDKEKAVLAHKELAEKFHGEYARV